MPWSPLYPWLLCNDWPVGDSGVMPFPLCRALYNLYLLFNASNKPLSLSGPQRRSVRGQVTLLGYTASCWLVRSVSQPGLFLIHG